jgi:hypothetical protein
MKIWSFSIQFPEKAGDTNWEKYYREIYTGGKKSEAF